MSDSVPVAGGLPGPGLTAGRAAGDGARADGRGRISANSFRLLTAKLKKTAPEDLPPPAAAVAAPVPASVAPADPAPEPVPEVSIPVLQAFVAPAAPEMPPPAPVAEEVAVPEVSVPVLLDTIEEPVAIAEPVAVLQEPDPEPEPELPASSEDEAVILDLPPPQIALPQFSPLTWSPASAAGDVPDLQSVEPPPVHQDTAAPAEMVEAPDDVAPWAAAEDLSPAEPEPEPERDFGPVPEPEALVATTGEPEPPLAEQPVAPAIEEEPETAAVADGAPASEMTGRVVDAMLKTISSAIYAKPTSSERAAFLREIAALMEQDEAAPPAHQAAAAPVAPRAAAVVPPPAPAAPRPAINAVIQEPAPAAPAEAEPIGDVLADRLGPSAALRKPTGDEQDPFAEPPKPRLLDEPKLTETAEADEETGELALTLLDMMSGVSGTALPQERTLAADTLLRIVPRIPVKQLLAVVERVAIMEAPPPLLVAKLIRDTRPEIVGPLLERCSHISDQDLMNAAPSGDTMKLRMMARRRILSQVLSDYLIASGEPNVLLTLIRNPGAALSHDAFYQLAEQASQHHALLAPLATRADLPPPVAFELFWHVPPELRRFIFSRFLTDSETLNKILRITLATHAGDGEAAQGEQRFAPRQVIDAAIDRAVQFKLDEAAQQFATAAGIERDTALRILSDREGEPVTVLLKALGYPRSGLEEAMTRLRHPETGLLRPERKPEELQAVFDGLSFNKARILLTYWDWFVRKAGPYAPHN